MTWLRAMLNGNGYKNVLEVYMYTSNENTFTRMIMKRCDSRKYVSVRTMQLHAKNNVLLQSLNSRASLS